MAVYVNVLYVSLCKLCKYQYYTLWPTTYVFVCNVSPMRRSAHKHTNANMLLYSPVMPV